MSGSLQNAQQQATQSLAQKMQGAQQAGIAQPAPAPSYIQPAPRTGVNYYQTTLEPMQMLQSARSGQQFLNHVFQRPAQYLPAALPSYSARVNQLQSQGSDVGGGGGVWSGPMENAGPGTGVGEGGAAAAAAAGGDGGGGGGGSK